MQFVVLQQLEIRYPDCRCKQHKCLQVQARGEARSRGSIMRTAGRRWILAAAGAAMVAVPGCAPLLDEILVPAGSGVVTGEIRSLDSRNGRLQVRDERSNRTETLRYD
jgi:hypothetical protein